MRRADQIAGLVLLAFALSFSAVALQYPYWVPAGPASGFMPFWLGVTMAILAALLLIGAIRTRGPGERWMPEGRGLWRLGAVLLASVLFVALLKTLGMILCTALFLVTLLRFVEGHSWARTLAIAAGAAAVNYLVFARWLRVPLPAGILGF